jgi:hypothetical protein
LVSFTCLPLEESRPLSGVPIVLARRDSVMKRSRFRHNPNIMLPFY